MQTSQHNTLVHIVSILNVTRYATQVNRHRINNLIDAVHTTSPGHPQSLQAHHFTSHQHQLQPDDITHKISVC